MYVVYHMHECDETKSLRLCFLLCVWEWRNKNCFLASLFVFDKLHGQMCLFL